MPESAIARLRQVCLDVRHKQKKKMKCIKIILVLMISIVQISCGQDEPIGYEKRITTIEFLGNTSDTTIQNIKFDSQGNQIEELPNYITILNPIQVDTIRISDKEIKIEYTWNGNSKSVTKEFKTHKKEIRIESNGIDTTYYSEFNYNEEGFPMNGIIVNNGVTSRYEIFGNVSMDEIIEIHSNTISDSEFIDFNGIIKFFGRRKVLIAELKEPRNTIEVRLSKNLKPKKVIKRKWHEYHKMIF